MYGKTKSQRFLFTGILVLVGAALAGSIWAWLDVGSCGTCGSARDLLGGRSLAPIGVAFYGALMLAGLTFGRTRVFFSALLLAAATHVVLLLSLVQHGVFCWPCILTGASAILGAGLSFWADTDNLARGSVLLPIGALVAHTALFTMGLLRPLRIDDVVAAVPTSERSTKTEAREGTARLLVFTRSGCRYCDEFEQDVLPELLREFSGRLDVSREQAPESLPTPTIVISGQERSVFPGLPHIARLRDAILRALGKVSYESSMLPKP
jgi:hypothetical protein